MAAAELDGVHQETGNDEVGHLDPRAWPEGLQQQDHGHEAREPEAEAQREERERRSVLQPDLGDDVAAAPDGDEIPGEKRVLRSVPCF